MSLSKHIRAFAVWLSPIAFVTATALCAVAPAGAYPQFGTQGSGAGQMSGPWGVAVSQASGDLYVGDTKNKRIDEFDSSGRFVRAWGWGVLNTAKELQTCTTACLAGAEGTGPGQFDEVLEVSVDNNPLSPSFGDVYVGDGSNHRVDKFTASGEFLLSWGEKGSGDGQFKGYAMAVSVGPTGRVYAGDDGRVQVFEPNGTWVKTLSLTSLSASAEPRALVVDAAGDMFVADEHVPGVHEFDESGKEVPVQLDAGSAGVTALTLDGNGDLFIAENSSGISSAGELTLLEYSPSGEQLASFAHGAINGFIEGTAYASVGGVGLLYVTNTSGSESQSNVTTIPVPVAGPPTIEVASATPERRGCATFQATLDAEGNATEYSLEYVAETNYQTGGYTNAQSTPETSLGSKFQETHVSLPVCGLVPGEAYHYRFVVTNIRGSNASADQVVTTIPPALISGPWVTNVTDASATLFGEIDPLGVATEYRLEYGESKRYEQTLSGSAGEGEGYMTVEFHRQGLIPGTTYHYRIVVHNEVGTYATPDHVFTTQASGGEELTLPDGRAWELVSPPDKAGALLGPVPPNSEFGVAQAATDGNGITYRSSFPIGENVVGHIQGAQILSRRGDTGWVSDDISEYQSLPPEGESATNLFLSAEAWPLFSPNLSIGVLEPGEATPPQSPDASERTLYLRNNTSGAFQPIETPSDGLPGVKFDDPQMQFETATPDLNNVVFKTAAALTRDAETEHPRPGGSVENIYEWGDGRLKSVNVLPNGLMSEHYNEVGASELVGDGMTARAISEDGRWVVWNYGSVDSSEPHGLFVRDIANEKTYQVGGAHARFETMSKDGSKVFFVETSENEGATSGDLYVFNTETGTQTDLTASHQEGESSADVQANALGADEDGSYIYFVATGALTDGAIEGSYNLYVAHEAAGIWSVTLIATLSSEDYKSWRNTQTGATAAFASTALFGTSSRVSPNGRYLAFMSSLPLTGYDNRDAASGERDEEVYLYDADTKRLVCASCNPTGARPTGVFDDGTTGEPLLMDIPADWSSNGGSNGTNHWLAASLPPWDKVSHLGTYQPRYLSDSGRLFFDSSDALVPQDTNGLEDVYEYEPVQGNGPTSDNCLATSPMFIPSSAGCVSLISSGQSASESVFLDASESGDDVFFLTAAKLVPEDYDTSYDVYDAHVCSVSEPCPSHLSAPPPCTSGDSCKAAPSPQPEIFGPASSATFVGSGNVAEKTTPSASKRKPKQKRRHKSVKRHRTRKRADKPRKASLHAKKVGKTS